MPTVPERPPARWQLPDRPDLDWLRRRAKRLRRRASEGEPKALALIAAYDPGRSAAPVPLSRAQRVLARGFGFADWSALRQHLRVIEQYSRTPEPVGPGRVREVPADRWLRLGCLSYTRFEDTDRGRAEDLLAGDPKLAEASVWTLAAAGRADALADRLRDDPAAVNAEGGPFGWPPLLYLCYARLGTARGEPVDTARVLLRAGADPDAGFLWHGLTSPFTALTGVFGGGENGEIPHPDELALARLLLDQGADPNDNQTLYNRMFTPADSHLELLLSYGLGTQQPSVWRHRLGTTYPSPSEMVGEQLRYAAARGFVGRVRLLLNHGVDPETTGYHPMFGDQTPFEIAVRHGQLDVATVLEAAGATVGRVDRVDRLVGAALNDDSGAVAALREADPGVVERAGERHPGLVQLAVEQGRLQALPLLLELGFDVNGADRLATTACIRPPSTGARIRSSGC